MNSYPTLTSFSLKAAERLLIEAALQENPTIIGASKLLGITRHALTRRMRLHGIPKPGSSSEVERA